jgi:ABC-2 type transport system ATP-binding protein
MSERVIEAQGLTRSFQGRNVVDRLELWAEAGEWYIFLGHNGAGKTTTIKMLLGLLQPSSGTGRVLGCDIRRDRTRIHQLTGYMPENLRPYEYLTGAEYLEFVGDVYRLERGRCLERIAGLVELLEMGPVANKLIKGYSLGTKKKLGFAAALLHEPKVLFLDEPTADLDPRAAELVRRLIRALCDRGMTVFMTTHILSHAERFCDKVGILNRGRLIVQESPSVLRAQHDGADLEQIFLRLTGDVEDDRVARFLRGSSHGGASSR